MDKNRLTVEIQFELEQLRLLPETVELLTSIWLKWLENPR